MTGSHVVSTGRGGAGNLGDDPNTYVDGDIVREGYENGDEPAHHTGRGGFGNRGGSSSASPNTAGGAQRRSSTQEVIPETATREGYSDFHTGRGGEGNVHKDKYGGHSGPQGGIADKFKHAFGGKDGEKKPEMAQK